MNLKDLRSTDVHAPIFYPLKDGSSYELGIEKINEFIEAYPHIDVYQELIKARVWNINNPRKRKTARGICSHLNKWLSSAAKDGKSGKAVIDEQDWRKDYE